MFAYLQFQLFYRKRETSVYVDILKAEPSSYFKGLKPLPPSCKLETWTSCVERDMRLATTHPPATIYEQMIQWTNSGMMWHFPIDNFQGTDDKILLRNQCEQTWEGILSSQPQL